MVDTLWITTFPNIVHRLIHLNHHKILGSEREGDRGLSTFYYGIILAGLYHLWLPAAHGAVRFISKDGSGNWNGGILGHRLPHAGNNWLLCPLLETL